MCEVKAIVKLEPGDANANRFARSPARPYQCVVCLRAFSREPYLQQHLAIHQKLNPFRCDICQKTFRFSSGLKTHASVHQANNLAFECPAANCTKTFRLRGNLKQHMKKWHYPSDEELNAIWNNIPALKRKKTGSPQGSGYVKREVKSEGHMPKALNPVANNSVVSEPIILTPNKKVVQQEKHVTFWDTPTGSKQVEMSPDHIVSSRLSQLLMRKPCSEANWCDYCGQVVESKEKIVAHLWAHVSAIKGVFCFECTLSNCNYKSNHLGDALAHQNSHPAEEGCKMVDNRVNLDDVFFNALGKYFKNLQPDVLQELYNLRHN